MQDPATFRVHIGVHKKTTGSRLMNGYLNPEEPTFLGFLILISLYKSLKR